MDPLAATYNTNTIPRVVLTILATIVVIILWWCIYVFIRAIFLVIFSYSDEGNKTKAANSIRYMIIWLIMCLVFLFFFPILFKQVRVVWYEYYTPRNVFIRAGEIIRELFSITTIIRDGYQWSRVFDKPINTDGSIVDTEL